MAKQPPTPRSIPTLDSLHKLHRKLSKHSLGVQLVLSRMRSGARLYCEFERGCMIWRLSCGPRVEPDVVKQVIADPHVVGERDSLFVDTPSQTYRYETEKTNGQ